jgi:hypothetical protein
MAFVRDSRARAAAANPSEVRYLFDNTGDCPS